MMSIFPSHVDTIIIGTGLTNSILAAACSRIGKSVLHLDENSYYGGYEASFTFQQLIDWINKNHPQSSSTTSIPQELLDKSRMFCLDLAPRFLFTNGSMVNLLINSNVSRYHEFKNNIRILCIVGQNEIHVMPCRRNEVFTSPLLSDLTDKRRLMKFIEDCGKYTDEVESGSGDSQSQSEISKHADKSIGEYLESRGLKPTLREYIMNAIAMTDPSDTTVAACKKIKKFMIAMEKYGVSPFLFPLYGCGEFPQSFCRLSAVFGGVYCLTASINQAVRVETIDEGTNLHQGGYLVKFGADSHSVTSDMLVVDQQTAIRLKMRKDNTDNESKISRAILITKNSIVALAKNEENDKSTTKDVVSFLRIPPSEGINKETVYLIELNSSALICPQELNVIYMWTKSTRNQTAAEDLGPTTERLFPVGTPSHESLIWKFYYQQVCKFGQKHDSVRSLTEESSSTNVIAGNLFVTNPVFDDVDYASVIHEAETLFKRMCPDQEFLPRAPDPDEIIYNI